MHANVVPKIRKKVLFAEDDEDVRLSMVQLLAPLKNVELLIAKDGTEAISMLSPDLALVLVDYQMPGANGNEVLRKAVDICPRAKRVILSAYAKRDLETTWAHQVLQKPDGAIAAADLVRELG